MEIGQVFASNLKALRAKGSLSQEEVAHQAGLDRTYISSLERCIYSPTIDVVDKLAKVLGVTAADMLREP